MEDLKRLEITARRAESRHRVEQQKGDTDGSVQQTRRMYLAVSALQRAAGARARAQRSRALRAAGAAYTRSVQQVYHEERPHLTLIRGGRA